MTCVPDTLDGFGIILYFQTQAVLYYGCCTVDNCYQPDTYKRGSSIAV